MSAVKQNPVANDTNGNRNTIWSAILAPPNLFIGAFSLLNAACGGDSNQPNLNSEKLPPDPPPHSDTVSGKTTEPPVQEDIVSQTKSALHAMREIIKGWGSELDADPTPQQIELFIGSAESTCEEARQEFLENDPFYRELITKIESWSGPDSTLSKEEQDLAKAKHALASLQLADFYGQHVEARRIINSALDYGLITIDNTDAKKKDPYEGAYEGLGRGTQNFLKLAENLSPQVEGLNEIADYVRQKTRRLKADARISLDQSDVWHRLSKSAPSEAKSQIDHFESTGELPSPDN